MANSSWSFLKKQNINFGDITNEIIGSVSLGGVLTDKVGGKAVNLGIRFRTDKGFGRGKLNTGKGNKDNKETITSKIKEIIENINEDGIRHFYEQYVVPDIYENNDCVFQTGGFNLYKDGTDWPENSNLWKKFKIDNLNETVRNPYFDNFNVDPEFEFFTVKYTTPGMLTGKLRDVLANENSEDTKNKLQFHITGKNLYVGSALPYLSDFQTTRPVLFIGENQKKQWLKWLQKFALGEETTDGGRWTYKDAKDFGVLDKFKPVNQKYKTDVKDLMRLSAKREKTKKDYIKKKIKGI